MGRYNRPHQKSEGKPEFYYFSQNNSGGHFDIDDEAGIGPHVWIEATSPEHANQIAESMGIYFDGVNKGQDCRCCGDRWYSVWSPDVFEVDPEYHFNRHDTIYVHKLDGTLEKIKKPK